MKNNLDKRLNNLEDDIDIKFLDFEIRTEIFLDGSELQFRYKIFRNDNEILDPNEKIKCLNRYFATLKLETGSFIDKITFDDPILSRISALKIDYGTLNNKMLDYLADGEFKKAVLLQAHGKHLK